MFRTRLITALVGAALMIFCLYQGGIWWSGLFLVLALVAFYEYADMLRQKNIPVLWLPGGVLLILLWASPLLAEEWIWAGLMAVSLMVVAAGIWFYPRLTVAELSLNLFGPVYLGLTLQYSLRILNLPDPFMIMLLALLLTWASDVGGYALGLLWGKRKLAPQLSPKKTWEGALGSVLFCLAVALLYLHFTALAPQKGAYLIILALFASLAAQMGDLFMSAIKRYFGVKDSGFIIPGHGGVLDRFDSFLLVLPLVYYGCYFLV
ncbi:MAG: phosphatidate cytidylyltransferase [Syntrophomonadaceae bacterium]|jgi:phosphatidate cytidylyltransferase|nr:phosphatidate cytidylyltransferase [Syntrophomonadaceae bacterium]